MGGWNKKKNHYEGDELAYYEYCYYYQNRDEFEDFIELKYIGGM